MAHGWSIVAGRESRRGAVEFRGFEPAAGRDSAAVFRAASPEDVDGACRAAGEAFEFTRRASGEARARLLEGAAARVERMGDELLGLASRETGLEARPRLEGELRRTVFTLRMFAGVAREGHWTRVVVEPADAERTPTPKPELRSVLRPLGPVAVFGAGNFPLAYSTAGGDTASALAAGCPVVVKGHPGHPGTGEAVAWAVCEAAREAGFPAGVFSFLHAGGEREMEVGREVVLHPAVRAVGFTGSFGGGMALAELARGREEPIPVFAEMGSVNPVFVLPGAMARGGPWGSERIGAMLAASVANSHGQMCTCPGLVFVVRGGPAGRRWRLGGGGLGGAGGVVGFHAADRGGGERRGRSARDRRGRAARAGGGVGGGGAAVRIGGVPGEPDAARGVLRAVDDRGGVRERGGDGGGGAADPGFSDGGDLLGGSRGRRGPERSRPGGLEAARCAGAARGATDLQRRADGRGGERGDGARRAVAGDEPAAHDGGGGAGDRAVVQAGVLPERAGVGAARGVVGVRACDAVRWERNVA
ncbi:MAG: aldehyde dehydrogenase family protein [Phycisphaeraceae bacterium]|nr:aldehyde dehydrogenase family protein [Phycisphaeraceae bacterium]